MQNTAKGPVFRKLQLFDLYVHELFIMLNKHVSVTTAIYCRHLWLKFLC